MRHRQREDDETGLLPATVEELAAQERRQARFGRRQLAIIIATASLLVTGAAAWALARPASQLSPLALPSRSADVGPGFDDGFGMGTPSPSPAPNPSTTKPQPSTNVSPIASVLPSDRPSATVSRTPSGSNSTAGQPPVALYYQIRLWQGGYTINATLRNTGTVARDWEVRMELPPTVTITSFWNVTKSQESGNIWIFRPTTDLGQLKADGYASFGVQGARPQGSFKLVSCTVNGQACVSGQPPG